MLKASIQSILTAFVFASALVSSTMVSAAELAVDATEIDADALLRNATFAQDSRAFFIPESRRQVGIVATNSSSFGITYGEMLPHARRWWATTIVGFGSDVAGPEADKNDTGSWYAEHFVAEKNRFSLMGGIDQIIHLTRNKYWGLLVGLGLGAAHANYDAVYYPKVCGPFYCGIDVNKKTEIESTDNYAFSFFRFGAAILETPISDYKGSLIIAIEGEWLRFPKDLFLVDPSGNSKVLPRMGSIMLETAIDF